VQATQRKSYLTLIIVVSAAFAAAMMALFALPLVKVAYANVQNLYVIYYCHLVN
jgi:hypothetical protein